MCPFTISLIDLRTAVCDLFYNFFVGIFAVNVTELLCTYIKISSFRVLIINDSFVIIGFENPSTLLDK